MPVIVIGGIPIQIGRSEYGPKETIIESGIEKITKKTDNRGKHPKIVYTVKNYGDQETASLAGYLFTPEIFYVGKFRSQNKKNGIRFPTLWNHVEEDMQKSGIEKLCARVYFRLVPLVKKIGFEINPISRKAYRLKKRYPKFLRAILPPYIFRVSKNIKP